jgi:hypothetical protein
LRVFGEENIHRILLVDNFAYNYVNQLGHGVPIVPYTGGVMDTELYKLTNYLLLLGKQKNAVELNSGHFNLGYINLSNNLH